MTVAEGKYEKTVAETKSIVVDCSGALAVGETISSVDAATQTDAAGAAIAGGDQVNVSGETANAAKHSEPGRAPIEIGRGIECFISGGKASPSVAQPYLVTFPYTTSNGQILVATVKLTVKP